MGDGPNPQLMNNVSSHFSTLLTETLLLHIAFYRQHRKTQSDDKHHRSVSFWFTLLIGESLRTITFTGELQFHLLDACVQQWNVRRWSVVKIPKRKRRIHKSTSKCPGSMGLYLNSPLDHAGHIWTRDRTKHKGHMKSYLDIFSYVLHAAVVRFCFSQVSDEDTTKSLLL